MIRLNLMKNKEMLVYYLECIVKKKLPYYIATLQKFVIASRMEKKIIIIIKIYICTVFHW